MANEINPQRKDVERSPNDLLVTLISGEHTNGEAFSIVPKSAFEVVSTSVDLLATETSATAEIDTLENGTSFTRYWGAKANTFAQTPASGATLYLQQSFDNTTWISIASEATALDPVSGKYVAVIEAPLSGRFVRAILVNGANMQTTHQISLRVSDR